MHSVSTDYLLRAETWLLVTTLVYFLMNGAQIFETVVLIPRWTANAPESMNMFKGQYGIDLKTFWIVMHAVHEITFILALVFCWQLDIHHWLLFLFIVHFAVRIWTLLYFAPKVISFQQSVNGGKPINDINGQTRKWRRWNYLRVGLFIGVSLGLMLLYLQLPTR